MQFTVLRNRRAFLAGLGVTAGTLLLPGGAVLASGRRVALLLTGSIADGGWSQLAYLGLMDLQAQGFATAYAEGTTQARIPEMVRGYADDGYELVIGHGYEFGSAMTEIASEYPTQKFFVSAFKPVGVSIPNLQFINLAFTQVAYAAGVLAALISVQGKAVGFVGGGDNPTQQSMYKAFIGGAEATRPGIRGLGVVTGDFDNATKGKEAALTMIGNGADVIFHAADITGLGAIQGAAGAGVRIIGCYSDQTTLAPAHMATSLVVGLRWMVGELGAQLAANQFKGGSEWQPRLAELWVPSYATTRFNTALVPDELRTRFEATYQEISSGAISMAPFQLV